MAEQAPFYIFTAFIFSYGTGTLHVSRDFLLTAVLAASVVSFFSIPFFGYLSDRIGRKNMYMIGAIVTGVFGFVYFGHAEHRRRNDHIPRDRIVAYSARHDVQTSCRFFAFPLADRSERHHQEVLAPPGVAARHFERDPIPYALENDWPVGAAGFEDVPFRSKS